MYSLYDDGALLRRVSPFRHPRIPGYVPLPAAFRSLSRLSSAPGAKASALRPFLLNLPLHSVAALFRFCVVLSPFLIANEIELVCSVLYAFLLTGSFLHLSYI